MKVYLTKTVLDIWSVKGKAFSRQITCVVDIPDVNSKEVARKILQGQLGQLSESVNITFEETKQGEQV